MSEVMADDEYPSSRTQRIIRYRSGKGAQQFDDELIQETPVALEFNGIAYTVMMCTPTHLEEFAIGFALTEGIIDKPIDIHDIEIAAHSAGITLSVQIANRCVARLKERRRSLTGMTGCGICGTEKLDGVCRVITPLPTTAQFNIEHLDGALSSLTGQQTINQQTGSSHAAAYVDDKGIIGAVFEDVGRHIALDKLIGWVSRNGVRGGAILVTSRASFEMVQKVAASGIEILLAVSAATSMAVELAQSLNITLAGYCRQGRANIYTHANRICGLNINAN